MSNGSSVNWDTLSSPGCPVTLGSIVIGSPQDTTIYIKMDYFTLLSFPNFLAGTSQQVVNSDIFSYIPSAGVTASVAFRESAFQIFSTPPPELVFPADSGDLRFVGFLVYLTFGLLFSVARWFLT